LLDLANADPYPRIDIALAPARHRESEPVVRRIAGAATRIEAAARGTPNIAADAELRRERRIDDAGADGAILQRGRLVIEPDQAGEFPPDDVHHGVDRRAPLGGKIESDAAGHDAIAHQPMAEGRIRRAQHPLAQRAAMRMHQRESRVVADGADITEMIGETLELGHQRAQPLRPRRRGDAERIFGGAGKSDCIGDRAIARDAAGELRTALEAFALHQPFDSLMHVAQAFFEPHHRLAIGGEAEMAGLDDSGVNRSNRNLMEALAFDRKERVSRERAGLCGGAERRGYAPASVIEPRPGVGRALRLQAEEILDRALEADRRRMNPAERRETAR